MLVLMGVPQVEGMVDDNYWYPMLLLLKMTGSLLSHSDGSIDAFFIGRALEEFWTRCSELQSDFTKPSRYWRRMLRFDFSRRVQGGYSIMKSSCMVVVSLVCIRAYFKISRLVDLGASEGPVRAALPRLFSTHKRSKPYTSGRTTA